MRDTAGKIITIEQLSSLSRRDADVGPARIVLAHGVFDWIHYGHLKHLEAAKREGEVEGGTCLLVVSVTADEFVNKGPYYPFNPAEWRAEMLAAHECVDWVVINKYPTAEPVIDALRPDIYIKGSDYQNSADDVTGKIDIEREAVERHNGRLVFTREISFSSSQLKNRYLNIYDPPLRDVLERLRQENALGTIIDLIESVSNYTVVLVGEAIMDEYQDAEPLGKPAKEDIIAVRLRGREVFAGGVIAAANHVADFVKRVHVITVIGEATPLHDRALIFSSARPNVTIHALRPPAHAVIRKIRKVEPIHTRKLFEEYDDEFSRPPPECAHEIKKLINAIARDADVVIATDYGHGMLTRNVIRTLTTAPDFLAVNTQINAGNQGFNLITKYLMNEKIHYICLDAPEARRALSDSESSLEDIINGLGFQFFQCDNIVITHGAHGCVTLKQGIVRRIPAFTNSVVDTMGAGDAFLAVTAPLMRAGGRMDLVGVIGNMVGAMKVGVIGHRQSVEKVALIKALTAVLK